MTQYLLNSIYKMEKKKGKTVKLLHEQFIIKNLQTNIKY